MLMSMNSFHFRANLVTQLRRLLHEYCLQLFTKWAGFSDGDFRDDGSKFQHVGPETANAREPYVTVRVRG